MCDWLLKTQIADPLAASKENPLSIAVACLGKEGVDGSRLPLAPVSTRNLRWEIVSKMRKKRHWPVALVATSDWPCRFPAASRSKDFGICVRSLQNNGDTITKCLRTVVRVMMCGWMTVEVCDWVQTRSDEDNLSE